MCRLHLCGAKEAGEMVQLVLMSVVVVVAVPMTALTDQ